MDAIGEKIEGIGLQNEKEKIEFQNAINELTSAEFESLSAYILKIAGCETYWRTPESHDQGLDAFGYLSFLTKPSGEWFAGVPRLILLAQAKHFSTTKVGSKDIREFIGSKELAIHKIYSTIDDRYSDLDIPPFSPVGLLFITTEEVPLTVKRLGVRSGMVILSSDDLHDLLVSNWTKRPKKLTRAWLLKELRKSIKNIPKAN
ncbi:MAG: restriction endonuclease [Blastocatellia bacterium]|nr:restriction endonuclease [Blastocatellia bacterium]